MVVDGNFTVIDPTKKHGAIKSSATGQYHTLYSVESPEPWLEDFGTGTLVNGKVEIMLDPTFADVIHTEDYHVFLTSHDPQSRGLAVGTRHANGFAVQEHAGGTSGGTFRYRVVARPKSDNKAARLATFTVPNITIPTIADLPKPPSPLSHPKCRRSHSATEHAHHQTGQTGNDARFSVRCVKLSARQSGVV